MGFGRAGLQAHEGVGEIVVAVVVLRAEIIAFGLAFLADQLGVGEALVHVVRNRAHVVEEFGINRPAAVLVEHGRADQPRPGFGDGIAQGESLAFDADVAEAFVGQAVFVGGIGRAGEPAFVDAAAISPVGVPIVGMQFDPLAGVQKAAGHPGGC